MTSIPRILNKQLSVKTSLCSHICISRSLGNMPASQNLIYMRVFNLKLRSPYGTNKIYKIQVKIFFAAKYYDTSKDYN